MSKAEIVGTVTVSSAGVINRIKNGLKNNRDSSRVSLCVCVCVCVWGGGGGGGLRQQRVDKHSHVKCKLITLFKKMVKPSLISDFPIHLPLDILPKK